MPIFLKYFETLIVEAPDHGHETTSEAYSYLLWLQAVYGKITGDWTKFNGLWEIMEKYMTSAGWSWRIGSSFARSGYQNPLAEALKQRVRLRPPAIDPHTSPPGRERSQPRVAA